MSLEAALMAARRGWGVSIIDGRGAAVRIKEKLSEG